MSIFTYNLSIIDSAINYIIPYIWKYKLYRYFDIRKNSIFYINTFVEKILSLNKSNLYIKKKKLIYKEIIKVNINATSNINSIINDITIINDDDWGWYIIL